jgi:hypothetical protein
LRFKANEFGDCLAMGHPLPGQEDKTNWRTMMFAASFADFRKTLLSVLQSA